eukprot:107658-Chlamydomonas_euryale.AAC.8
MASHIMPCCSRAIPSLRHSQYRGGVPGAPRAAIAVPRSPSLGHGRRGRRRGTFLPVHGRCRSRGAQGNAPAPPCPLRPRQAAPDHLQNV